jgi:hypothetical protein
MLELLRTYALLEMYFPLGDGHESFGGGGRMLCFTDMCLGVKLNGCQVDKG